MMIGQVVLADGRAVPGIPREVVVTGEAMDITSYGEWREWMRAAPVSD